MSYTDEYLPISAVQHYAFCKRQFALIYMEQQWSESYLTSSGRLMHERVHDKDITETKDDILIVRGLTLSSEKLKLFGVADIIEYHKSERGIKIPGSKGVFIPFPVEYKRGKKKANDCDRLQLCVQCLCLEEMQGCEIESAAIFYGQPRRREVVSIDNSLREKAYKTTNEMHELYNSGISPRDELTAACKSCSMKNICQPELFGKKAGNYWRSAFHMEEE